MTRRLVAFVALAVALGALFVRLGIWQLDRRLERRAVNERVVRQLALPAVPLASLLGAESLEHRRATVEGTPDYANEVILAGRSRGGSPGVHIITPVRLAGHDTAVLVNRGWVYSPDAATVDPVPWREARTRFTGYTATLPSAASHPAAPAGGRAAGRTVRQLSHATLARLMPYPVHRVYLVAHDSATRASAPARLDLPVPGEGPHLSYAIQWFSFAAIALIGAAVVVLRARNSGGA